MRGFLVLCAVCALVWVGLVGLALSADTAADTPAASWTLGVPAGNVDAVQDLQTRPDAVAEVAVCSADVCTVGTCAVTRSAVRRTPMRQRAGLQAGQPVRNVGRMAAAPVRAVAAVRPLRKLAAGVARAAPLRRAAKAMGAIRPLRRLAGVCR